MKRGKLTHHVGLARLAFAGIFSFLLLLGTARAAEDWPPAPALQVPADTAPGALPPSVSAEAAGPSRWRCTFQFKPAAAARSVTLAGTFNGWNRNANPLAGPGSDGAYTATIELGPGVHQYKFVIDDQQWSADPQNPDGSDDGHGGKNSVLRLGRLANLRTSAAKTGDGEIDAIGLEHQPTASRYFQPLNLSRVLVRYQTLAHDVEHAWVAVKGGELTEMRRVHEDPLFALYEAEVPVPVQTDTHADTATLAYTFVLTDGAKRASDPHTYSRSFTEATLFKTPDWAKRAIWYQVFLDRFCNGDPNNDPDHVIPWTQDWFSPAPWEGQDGPTFYKYYVFSRFYGGDLAGLESKLTYLQGICVNALYLNPIFKATSNHKYDTMSYIHVDDHFGTSGDYDAVAATEDLLDPTTWKWTESDKLFLEFLKNAHGKGFRVIVDGVFNHVGRDHPAFQDVMKNGKNSRYADWFNIKSWEPFEYGGWAGTKDLPEFKKSATGLASESAKAHIFAVTRRWMDPDGDGNPSDGIDGWRLDVPNEIPAPFWIEWRQLVKSINPDAYITGEIWDRADDWLDGQHFDAVMNYPFARAVVSWVMDRKWKIKVSEFDRRLEELRLAYPLPATLVLQNLMDSHDTDRLASMAINPDRAYDHANRVQDNGPNYDNSKPTTDAFARARLAAFIQMTYIGAPMIYYGDEVGMWGADDPTCRKPMLWIERPLGGPPDPRSTERTQLAYYTLVTRLRRSFLALQTGSFQTLLTDDEADVWAFLRADANDQVVVVINASDQPRRITVPLPPNSPTTWTGAFEVDQTIQAQDGKLLVPIQGLSGIAFRASPPK